MLTVRLVTQQGETVQLDVKQCEFVRKCPHCDLPFRTIDPDQIYPSRSCQQRAYEMRRILRESRSAGPEVSPESRPQLQPA